MEIKITHEVQDQAAIRTAAGGMHKICHAIREPSKSRVGFGVDESITGVGKRIPEAKY